MSAQADREVVFSLKPEVADGAAKVFGDFAGMGERANDRLATSHKTAAERAASHWETTYSRLGMGAAKSYESLAEQAVKSSERQSQAITSVSKAEQAMDREAAKLKQGLMTAQDQHNARVARYGELLAANKIKQDDYARGVEQSYKRMETAAKRQADADERDRKKMASAADKQLSDDIDRLSKLGKETKKKWDDEKKDRDKAESDERKASERQQKERDALYSRAERAEEGRRQSAMMMKESAIEAAQGALLATRGFAELGILSETTSEGLLKAFIRVQAGYDILEGGFRIYKKLTEMVEAYRKTVEAAALAERALAASQALSGAAGAASGAGRASKAGGGFLSNVFGGAVAGRMAGGGGLGLSGAGGIAVNPVAAGVTIGAGALAVGTLMTPWGQRTSRDWMIDAMYNDGEGPGWFGRSYAYLQGGYGNYRETRETFAALDESKNRTSRMERERAFRQSRAEQYAEEAALRGAADRERSGIEYGRSVRDVQNRMADDYRTQRLGATQEAFSHQAAWEGQRPDMLASEEQKAKWQMAGSRAEMEAMQRQRELAAWEDRDKAGAAYNRAGTMADDAHRAAEEMRSRVGTLAATGKIDGRTANADDATKLRSQAEAAYQREQEAMARLTQTNQERLAAEERIRDVRISAADEAIGKTREEISLREGLIEKERQRLMSAQERIASMSEGEKSEYKRVLDKARSGQDLTAEEFRQIGNVNTEETERLRREYADRMSKAFMDSTGLGKDEQQRIDRLRKEQEALQVRLKDDREMRVNIERDDGAMAQRISDEIVRQMGDRDRRLIEAIERNVEAKLAARDQRDASRARQLNQSNNR